MPKPFIIMNRFSGKVAIVTGAASGLGATLTLQLCRKGARVALIDIDQKGIGALSQELEKEGLVFRSYVADVSSAAEVGVVIERILKDFGGVDFLFNNAGISLSREPFWAISHENWNRLMEVNLGGVINCSRAVLPLFLEKQEGHVVNICSIMGKVSFPNRSAYIVSKFAIRGFSLALRQELKGTGVAVTIAYPGTIRTNIAKNSIGWKEEEMKQKAIRLTERPSVLSPEDAAAIILRAVERRRKAIYTGSDAQLLRFTSRFIPEDWYYSLFSFFHDRIEKIMDSVQKRKTQPSAEKISSHRESEKESKLPVPPQ